MPLPPPPVDEAAAGATPAAAAYKSGPGLGRVWRACGYSLAGLRAAWRFEAAFRQELALGLPLLACAWWLAPTRLQALLLCLAVVAVWVVELLNSALEALADAVSLDEHPLIKRAKDIASAAVMATLGAAALVWLVVLWP